MKPKPKHFWLSRIQEDIDYCYTFWDKQPPDDEDWRTSATYYIEHMHKKAKTALLPHISLRPGQCVKLKQTAKGLVKA